MKHDLRCLLCKIQIHCKAGDLASMRNHLKVEHDMVRYEVELMLHLCLINKREHDTIIKTLTFRLDLFVKEGLIENQVDLFQVKTKDEVVEKEHALADQTDATLNETDFKSFSAEESLVTEKPAENDPLSKTDEGDLGIEENSTQIDPESESVLNKSFVEVVVPSKPEVEVIEMEKLTTRKESLGPSEDLSLVIDDDEEDDDGVVVVKEAMIKDKEVEEAMNKDKVANEATNKDNVAKEAISKTDDFDLLILTDEPELIVELKESDGRSVEKQESLSLGLEKKGSKCRGAVEKKLEKVKLEVRVDLARIRTRSASVKKNSPQKGSSNAKSSEKKRRTLESGVMARSGIPVNCFVGGPGRFVMVRQSPGGASQQVVQVVKPGSPHVGGQQRFQLVQDGGKSQEPVRKRTRMESGGLEDGSKSQKQPVRKMTRRRIK